MTTENSAVADSGVPSMTSDEEAFFASGGETEIKDDVEAGAGGGDSGSGAPAPGADGKAPGGDKQPQHVPLAALHEERGKRKGLEKTVREQAEKLANFEGRFAVLDRLAPKKEGDGATETPAGPPTVQDDIFGNVKHTNETVAQIQKRLDDADAATKAAGDQQTFVNNYRADAAAFEAKPETTDYRDAYNHLLGTRAQELIAIGFDDPVALQNSGADPQDVHAAAKALHDALVADEFAIAERAFKSKKSPAEIIYNLAKQRGYIKKAAAGGKAPGEEKLDQIERGQQTNKSLNGAGGGTGDGDMTGERLLAMPMDEYSAWVEKHPAKARQLMGG